MPAQLVIGCLSEVDAALTERHWGETKQAHKLRSLIDAYPAECLKVARRFVEEIPTVAIAVETFLNRACNQSSPELRTLLSASRAIAAGA